MLVMAKVLFTNTEGYTSEKKYKERSKVYKIVAHPNFLCFLLSYINTKDIVVDTGSNCHI